MRFGRLQWFPGVSMIKNPPANAGNESSIPRLGRSLGEGYGNPFQYSCLGNAEEPGELQSIGSQNSQTRLSISTTMVLSLLSFNRGEFPWRSVLWSVLASPSLFFITCLLPEVLLARSKSHRDSCGSLNEPGPPLGEVLFRYLSKATAILLSSPKVLKSL